MTAFIRRIPHVHDGEPDTVTRSACGPNMVRNPTPGSDGSSWWTRSGVTTDSTTRTFKGFDASADYCLQILLTAALRGQYGTNGAPMVLSFFGKAVAGLTAGTMYFGIADGSASTYSTGHRWTVDYSDFSGTGWTRFWAFSDDTSPATAFPGASAATDVRYLFHGGPTPFDQLVLVTGFQVNHCGTAWLPPFNPGPQESQIRKYGSGSGQGGTGSNTCKAPVWDTTVAITNAVQITTRT